jgi:hypothetical protein
MATFTGSGSVVMSKLPVETHIEELLKTTAVARVVKRTPETARVWRRLEKITPAARTPSGTEGGCPS